MMQSHYRDKRISGCPLVNCKRGFSFGYFYAHKHSIPCLLGVLGLGEECFYFPVFSFLRCTKKEGGSYLIKTLIQSTLVISPDQIQYAVITDLNRR